MLSALGYTIIFHTSVVICNFVLVKCDCYVYQNYCKCGVDQIRRFYVVFTL